MGRSALCSFIVLVECWPNARLDFCWVCFHSLISYEAPKFTERSSCAKWRSPASGIGSSHGRLRSFGILSISELACACLSSRRSLASWFWVMAARFSEPSGLATIRTGESSLVSRVWPRKNAGSASLSSISISSSVSSNVPIMPLPLSASNMGYSVTGSTPDAISCRASHSSGDESFLPLFLPFSSSSSIWALRAPRSSPRLISVESVGTTELRMSAAACSSPSRPRDGSRSSPVCWFTSFMDRAILVAVMEITFTLTVWLRETSLPGSVTMPGRM
mmetsp:Transcript_30639/g.81488  ORF Transcript_30639/g.81488 Transcript_30639/m.81488 type:complete len:276 (-) Transcript_30639:302-1129(-)